MPFDSSRTVDVGDVRVIQGGEDLGLTLEPGDPFGISCERLGEDLDRHVPIELPIAGAVDLTHAARAEGSLNLVRPEPSASSQGHSVVASAIIHRTEHEG